VGVMVPDSSVLARTVALYGVYIAPWATDVQCRDLIFTYLTICQSKNSEVVDCLMSYQNWYEFLKLIFKGESLTYAFKTTGIKLILPTIPHDMPEPFIGFSEKCHTDLQREFLQLSEGV